jgi:flavin-dependent dehydrogenase
VRPPSGRGPGHGAALKQVERAACDRPLDVAARTVDPLAARRQRRELREEVVVEDLIWEDGRVVGVCGRSDGQPFEERARVVVGADGQHSLVARKVEAPFRESVPPLTFGYYTYWADVPTEGIEIIHRIEAGRVLIVFPTNENLTAIAVQGRPEDFSSFRADLEGEYLRAIDLVEELSGRVRAGRRAERFQGTGDLPNFIRVAAGPGWALAGDAAYHRDPLLAHGISDAFRDAEALAAAINRGLAQDGRPGNAVLDDALAEYEREHAEAARAGMQETMQACTMQPFPPELLGYRASIRGNQAAMDQFYARQFSGPPVAARSE